MRARVQSMVGLAAQRAGERKFFKQPEFDEAVENGFIVLGSPDEVAEQLRSLALDLNVGNLMLLLQFGNMSRELTFHNTRMFAERVAPQLAGLFQEWEHRWWPPNAAATRERTPA